VPGVVVLGVSTRALVVLIGPGVPLVRNIHSRIPTSTRAAPTGRTAHVPSSV
jgi:hypothetical protein